MRIDDPWDELGVPRGADLAVVKSAWRRLVAQWHPDRNNAPDAHARMQRINRAYELLSSGEVVDDDLGDPGQAGGWPGSGHRNAGPGFDRGHASSSWDQPRWTRGPGVKTPKPVQRTATLTIEEVQSGCQRSFKGSTVDLCAHCAGARYFTTDDLWCDACDGSGRLYDYYTGRSRRCKACDGSGDARRDCPECEGRGMASHARDWAVKANIPPGALPGDVVMVAGHGQRGADGERADLEIRIELKPHPLFSVDGQRRLCATVPVDIFSFMSKGSVEVPVLGGGVVRMDLGQGAVQEFPGLGLVDRAGRRGSLVVRATPVVPRELSERERLYLHALASAQQEEGFARCADVVAWRARANAYREAGEASEGRAGDAAPAGRAGSSTGSRRKKSG